MTTHTPQPWRYRPARDEGLGPTERVRDCCREVTLSGAISLDLFALGARAYFKLYHGLRIENRANFPIEPPAVIVANHTSHLDAPLLLSALPSRHRPRVYPVAAADTFFASPRTAMVTTAFLNALPIARGRCTAHALAELRKRLREEPCTLIVFPEGTRSRAGGMRRFRAGVGSLLAGTETPVVPCHIEGADEAMPPHARLPRPKRLTLRVGEPMRFPEIPNEREGWQSIADTLHHRITKLR